jgi:hypothetical protein
VWSVCDGICSKEKDRESGGLGMAGCVCDCENRGCKVRGVTSGSDAPGCGCPEPIGGWVCGPIAVPGTIMAIPDAEGDQPPRHPENLHRS